MSFSFRHFLERRKSEKPMGYLGTLNQEFGIDQLPITLDSSVELHYNGLPLVFNQVVLVPGDSNENDHYIKLIYINANQSNKNFSRPYIKTKKGLIPYEGEIPDGTSFTVPRNIVSKLAGKPFEDAVKQAGAAGS
jgi:hypothetical protein